MVVFLLLCLTLCCSATEAGAKTTPKYPYTDWQIYHLKGMKEAFTYDASHYILPASENESYYGQSTMSFDENGYLLSFSCGNKVENYKYYRKGYKLLDRRKNEYGKWSVTCDTTLRIRMDISLHKYPRNRSNVYTFDRKGRHTSTLFTKNDVKVLILFHYPDEKPFRPGRSWKGRDLGRSRGSKGSIWYNQVDGNGAWLAEVFEGHEGDTAYYTAHYVINGDGYQGEGVIIRYMLNYLDQYRNANTWASWHYARKCKTGDSEFEKAIAELGVFDGKGEIRFDPSGTSPLSEAIRRNPKGKAAEKAKRGSMVSKLGRTEDQRFLFKYIDIPLKTQTVICNILYAIICLVALCYAGTFKEQMSYSGLEEVAVAKAAIFFVSLCELAAFYLCPDAEPFLSKMNGIWKLVPIAAFLILFIGQFSSTVKLLGLGNDFSGRNAPLFFLYFGFVIFLIALMISLFAEDLRPYALAIGFGAIGLQIVIDLIATIVNRVSFGSFLLNTLWMIVCGSAIMLLAYGFAVLFVIVFFGYAFLSGLAHSGEPCCANCSTYSNGYCHYRNEQRAGGDCCSKHRW